MSEAEALTGLGAVQGPADEPPQPGDEESWTSDWLARGKDALRKAWELGQSGDQKLKERAARIARRIREGVENIVRAPVKGARKLGKATRESAKSLHEAARGVERMWTSSFTFGAAVLVAIVVFMLKK